MSVALLVYRGGWYIKKTGSLHALVAKQLFKTFYYTKLNFETHFKRYRI